MYYSFYQGLFTNTSSCTQASNLIALCNENGKTMGSAEIIDYEDYIYNRRGRPAPKKGLTTEGGANMTSEWFSSYFKIKCNPRKISFLGKIMNNLLDEGKIVVCTINITQEFVDQWFKNKLITGWEGKGTRYTASKGTGGHDICIAKKEGQFYIINSRKDTNKNVVKLSSLDLPGVFRTYEKAIIYSYI